MAGKAAKAAKRSTSRTGGARGRPAGQQRAKSKPQGFKTYIFKVLKKIDGKSDMRIGKKTMSILNSFLLDLFDRLAREAGSICDHSKRHTLGAREV